MQLGIKSIYYDGMEYYSVIMRLNHKRKGTIYALQEISNSRVVTFYKFNSRSRRTKKLVYGKIDQARSIAQIIQDKWKRGELMINCCGIGLIYENQSLGKTK